jgi:hypothetical protein
MKKLFLTLLTVFAVIVTCYGYYTHHLDVSGLSVNGGQSYDLHDDVNMGADYSSFTYEWDTYYSGPTDPQSGAGASLVVYNIYGNLIDVGYTLYNEDFADGSQYPMWYSNPDNKARYYAYSVYAKSYTTGSTAYGRVKLDW